MIESVITVGERILGTEDIEISVDITHGEVADMQLILRSPRDMNVELVSPAAGKSKGGNLRNVVFKDAAVKSISESSAPYTGAYKPDTYSWASINTMFLTPGNETADVDTRGAWTLMVSDTRRNGASGTINSWSITFKRPESQWKTIGDAISGKGILLIDSSDTLFAVTQDQDRIRVHALRNGRWLNIDGGFFPVQKNTLFRAVISSDNSLYVLTTEASGPTTALARYQDGKWSYVDAPGIKKRYLADMAAGRNGTIFIAHMQGHTGSAPARLSMEQYDGTRWMAVGKSDFTAHSAFNTVVDVDAKNTPWVAYGDVTYGAHNQRISVMYFDGAAWKYAEKQGFTALQTTSRMEGFKIDTAGVPHVLFEAFGKVPGIFQIWAFEKGKWTKKVLVKDWADYSWPSLGGTRSVLSPNSEYAMAFSRTNELFVSHLSVNNTVRRSHQYKAGVSKFSGGRLQILGGRDASDGNATDDSIVVDSKGQVYLMCSDENHGGKSVVKTFRP